jgi:hypothetical protein
MACCWLTDLVGLRRQIVPRNISHDEDDQTGSAGLEYAARIS